MRFTEIITWLGIFIMGSLIVTFLIFPGSFESFKDNIASFLDDITPDDVSISNIHISDNYVESSYTKAVQPSSCAQLELAASSGNIGKTEIKKQVCRTFCGFDEKEFHHFECITDKLHCYCRT